MKKIIAVVSVFALVALGTSVFASEGWMSGDDYTKIKVKIVNRADVQNNVATTSSTGGNTADASIVSNGDAGSQRAKGGMISTGEAAAYSGVLVGVNANDVAIDTSGCGCERDGDTTTKIKVKIDNGATVHNNVATTSNTGGNTADASIVSNGSAGSQRAKGGMIATGNAEAVSEVGTVANTNVVTITTN